MDKKLLAYLEENGISVRKTKHGYLASNPHGTVTWHRQHPRQPNMIEPARPLDGATDARPVRDLPGQRPALELCHDPRVIDQYEAGVTVAGTLAKKYRDDTARQAAIEKAVGRLIDGAD